MGLKETMALCCPKCGNDKELHSESKTWIEIYFDVIGVGWRTSPGTEFELEDDYSCYCPECEFEGTVKDFKEKK